MQAAVQYIKPLGAITGKHYTPLTLPLAGTVHRKITHARKRGGVWDGCIRFLHSGFWFIYRAVEMLYIWTKDDSKCIHISPERSSICASIDDCSVACLFIFTPTRPVNTLMHYQTEPTQKYSIHILSAFIQYHWNIRHTLLINLHVHKTDMVSGIVCRQNSESVLFISTK